MAIKDKLVNLEDLKAVNDHVEGEVSGLRSAIKINTQGNPFQTWAYTNPANTVHSSDKDQIDCHIEQGNEFIAVKNIKYISLYATYADGTTGLLSGTVITDDELIVKYTAAQTIVKIGFYVPSVNYERYVSAIIITNPVGMDVYNNTDKTDLALSEIGTVGNSSCLFEEKQVDTTASGWKLNDNGLCSSNSGYKLIKYQVIAGEKLKIVSDDKFQFQTVASVPSSGTNNRVGRTYQTGEYFLTVPETATYLIVSTPSTSGASVYKCSSLMDNALMKYYSAQYSINNKRYDISHTIVGSTGCRMTDYIPCSAGDVVEYYGYSFYYQNNPVMYCVAFLSADLSFISGKTQIDGETATTSKNGKITVTAPEGTAYVVGSNNGSSNTPYLRVYSYEHVLMDNTDKRAKRIDLIKRIKMARHIPGNHTERITFLHFSDSHKDIEAVNRIVADRVYFGNYIDDAICTGDFCADENDSTFSDWWNPAVMLCIGNHDVAKNNSGTYNWAYLSMADRTSRYIAPYTEGWGVTHESGKSYFYKDYAAANLRLIVLDVMLYNLSGTEAADQETWLTNLLADSITNNLHVLIACHSPHGGAVAEECSFSRVSQDVMPTYTDCNTPQSIIDIVAAKITGGLKFVGYLVGHTHQDNIWDAENDGTQLMYCITDARDGSNSTNFWKNSDQHRDATFDAYNIVTVDTRNTLVKIIRGGGADMDDHMRPRKMICLNYSTGEIVGEER